jgi:hypothetical protein
MAGFLFLILREEQLTAQMQQEGPPVEECLPAERAATRRLLRKMHRGEVYFPAELEEVEE